MTSSRVWAVYFDLIHMNFSSSFFFEPSWSGRRVARSSTFCSTRGQQRPTSGLGPLGLGKLNFQDHLLISSMDVLLG